MDNPACERAAHRSGKILWTCLLPVRVRSCAGRCLAQRREVVLKPGAGPVCALTCRSRCPGESRPHSGIVSALPAGFGANRGLESLLAAPSRRSAGLSVRAARAEFQVSCFLRLTVQAMASSEPLEWRKSASLDRTPLPFDGTVAWSSGVLAAHAVAAPTAAPRTAIERLAQPPRSRIRPADVRLPLTIVSPPRI